MIKNIIKGSAVMLLMLGVIVPLWFIDSPVISGGISFAADLSAALDPMYLGVGARALGMGKSYVAVAENADALLLNPAGLGNIDGTKIISMYSNLMGNANYMVLAGGMPLNDAVGIGAGFVSISVSDIGLYDNSGIAQGNANYMTGVVFLSAGVNLEKDGMLANLLPNRGKDILVGANVKLFVQNSSGSDLVSDVNGTGLNADLALLYQPDGWLKLGLNQQNALPSSIGGKVTFKNGEEEELPSTTKLGSKVLLMGPKGLIASEQLLDMSTDVDLTRWGVAGHFGLEYKPEKWLAIRAGLDQDSSPTGIMTNPTFGVGMKYAGFAFDYAYHPYGDLENNSTHFFSISYVGEEKEEKTVAKKPSAEPRPEVGERASLQIIEPASNSIVYDNRVNVKVKAAGLPKVEVNGVPAEKYNDLYNASVLLKKGGKNVIVARAINDNGEITYASRILKLVSFKDVSDDCFAKDSIESCGTLGLVQGFPDGTFLPNKTLSRAELATLVVRAKKLELPKVAKNVFKDVPASHWAAPYILAAKNEGLVKGYPDGTFRPNAKIKRVEGILVFARADGLEERTVDEDPYADIPAGHWAAGLITEARDAGLLDYLEDDNLEPNTGLPRAEAVQILSATGMAKSRIADLRNFAVGFDEMEKKMLSKKDIDTISFVNPYDTGD